MADKTISILLIEDDPDDVVLITDTLTTTRDQALSFVLKHKNTIASGLELLKKEQVDVVLLDLHLPDCNGIECLNQIVEAKPDLPVIILTGLAGEALAAEALRKGAQDYFLKGEIESRLIERSIRYAIERKGVERALREREEKYRGFFQASKDAVLITSRNGNIVEINDAGVELAGYKAQMELIGKKIQEFYTNPCDKIRFIRNIQAQGFVKDMEISLRKRDGTIIPALVSSVPIRDEKGEYAGYQSTVRDLTHQKSLERQLIQAKKMEAIGGMASGIAHDFNNMLNVLVKNIDFARQFIPRGHPIFNTMRSLEDVAQAGRELATQLLRLGKPGMPEGKILSLNQLTKDALTIIQAAIPDNIELKLLLSGDESYIRADSSLITLMITNMSLNARDAMPEGGKLTFETEHLFVDEEYCRNRIEATPGTYCMLKVRDTGLGIPAEFLERIYEPFFTTKEEGKGTGLGLSMVYSLVKNMGGWIECRSERNRGTEFSIFFRREKKPAELLEPRRRGNGTILLADDEEILLLFGQSVLEEKGYHIVAACDWEEVIDRLSENRETVSLAILDWSMPGHEGTEMLSQIHEIAPDLPIIICSSYMGDYFSDLPEGHSHAYIQKSYTPTQLIELVNKMLGN